MLLDKPSSILSLYSHSFYLLFTHFRKFFIFATVCTAIPISTTHFILSNIFLPLPAPSINLFHPHLIKDTLLLLLNLIISITAYAGLLLKINSVVREQPLTLLTLIKKTLIKIPFLFFALIISTTLLFIGSLLFFVPGFYILGMLFIFYPLLILENNNLVKDFSMSYQLIKNHWWHTFLSIGAPIILLSTFAASFSGLIASLISSTFFSAFLKLLIQILLMIFFVSWSCIQTVAVLNDLTLRKGIAHFFAS